MKKMLRVLVLSLCAVLCAGAVGCNKPQGDKLKVYAPDGAPALALAGMLSNYGGDYDFEVVASSTIGDKLTTQAADIAIVPINAAANLYNKGQDYRVAAYATTGNLYLVGRYASADAPALSDIVGKRVGVIGQGLVPDIVFQALLNGANIGHSVSDEVQAGAVAIRYYADGPAVMQAMTAEQIEFGLFAEPAVTGALGKLNGTAALDIQAEREKQTGTYGFPQAVLVVRGDVYDAKTEEVGTFLDRYVATGGWVEAHPAEAVAAVKAHMADGVAASIQALTAATAARCNIDTRRVEATDRTMIERFIDDCLAIKSALVGGAQPADGFYLYTYEG